MGLDLNVMIVIGFFLETFFNSKKQIMYTKNRTELKPK
jgi:hypothetical protein